MASLAISIKNCALMVSLHSLFVFLCPLAFEKLVLQAHRALRFFLLKGFGLLHFNIFWLRYARAYPCLMNSHELCFFVFLVAARRSCYIETVCGCRCVVPNTFGVFPHAFRHGLYQDRRGATQGYRLCCLTHKCPKISTNIYTSLQISANIYKYRQLSTSIHTYLRISTNIETYP